MDATIGLATTGRLTAATASPWLSAFGFWFTFTYFPPASLVGREVPMR